MTSDNKGIAFSIDEDQMMGMMRAALDALRDEVLITSKTYQVVLANARVRERIGDIDPVQRMWNCHDVHARKHYPCRQDQHPCVIQEVLRIQKRVVTNHLVIDDFGNTILMEVEGTPIWDETGEITWIVQVLREIPLTDQPSPSTPHRGEKQGDEVLDVVCRQTQHAHNVESLGALTESIAHDFNNLMVGVLGNTEFLLETVPDDSPIRDCLNDIFDAASRAASLSKQMTSYTGKQRFAVSRIRLDEIFDTVKMSFEKSVPPHIVLRYDIVEDFLFIDGNIVQIRLAVQNLISNAKDAIGEAAGVIRIRVGQIQYEAGNAFETVSNDDLSVGAYAYIEVSDTGEGMDPDTMKKIFDPRFTTKGVGHGLGLAAVLGIVRNLGGAIEVFSTLKEGSTFRLLFPICVSSDTHGIPPAKQADKPFIGCKALLADDEEPIREIAKYMLEHLGFEVKTAKDGMDTLRILQVESDFHLVLLDFTMPVMNGEACFNAIRETYKDLRVVLSSGHSEQEMTARFQDHPPEGYIQKPYRLEQLRTILEQSLRKT